jgi:hypothetical protein
MNEEPTYDELKAMNERLKDQLKKALEKVTELTKSAG